MTDFAERLGALEKDHQKVRGLLGEVAAVLWGDMVTRNNGIRSRVIALESRCKSIDDIEDRLQHYIDTERRETCYGLAGLARFESTREEDREEDADMTIATMKAQVESAASRRQTIGIIITAVLNALGLVIVAIISRGGVE